MAASREETLGQAHSGSRCARFCKLVLGRERRLSGKGPSSPAPPLPDRLPGKGLQAPTQGLWMRSLWRTPREGPHPRARVCGLQAARARLSMALAPSSAQRSVSTTVCHLQDDVRCHSVVCVMRTTPNSTIPTTQRRSQGGRSVRILDPPPPTPPPKVSNPSLSSLRFWGKGSAPKAPNFFFTLRQGVQRIQKRLKNAKNSFTPGG